jgi:hypothetical protein
VFVSSITLELWTIRRRANCEHGVDRVAYEPEQLKQLGEWAAQTDSVFSLEDRMGLVSDAMVLAKAGTGKTSAALDLIEKLRNEEESEQTPSFLL